MAFKRVRDILDRARQFHRALGDYYVKNAQLAGQEKSRVLLTYMSRHEQNMAECLARYEKEAAEQVLNEWFKFPPEMQHEECFECLALSSNISAEDISKTALKVDECLLRLYRQAAEKASSPAVRDLFNQLLALEKKEENKALRDALIFDQQS